MMPTTPPAGLIAVSKNGKFLGYADARQVREYGLTPYNPPAPEAPKSEATGAQTRGADPSQIKKAPLKSAK